MTGFSSIQPTTDDPPHPELDMDRTMSDPSPAPLPISPITDPSASASEKLRSLTKHAQHQISSQPLYTQRHLTCQTRELFQHYTSHGTASSLRNAITRYLKRGTNGQCHPGNKPPILEFSPHLPADYTPPDSTEQNPSRMVDEESRNLVRDMPFRVDRMLHIRPNVVLPPDLLEGIDRIFRIYQFQAEAMFQLCCEKYGDEAIFRVGIRSLILSRSETLFESIQSHPQHIQPETRLFLLQVYERHPDLNDTEKRIMARAVNVGVDIVEAFWQSMTELRAPYLAMRTVIAARELRAQRAYRAQREQELKRQQELQRQKQLLQQQQEGEQKLQRARELQQQQQRILQVKEEFRRRQREAMSGMEGFGSWLGEGKGRARAREEGEGEKEIQEKKRRRMGVVGLDMGVLGNGGRAGRGEGNGDADDGEEDSIS